MSTVITMTTTESQAANVAPADQDDRAWPRPWMKPDDREGWEVVARGQGRHNAPPVRTALLLSLDREQIGWLEDAATAANVSPEELMVRLLDEARQPARRGRVGTDTDAAE